MGHNIISDSGRIHTSFFDIGIWECSCQAEITYHYLTIVVHQDVCWFNVPMDDITAVKELDGTESVVHYNLDVSLLQTTLGACFDQVF